MKETGGYSGGDGNVGVEVVKCVFRLKLRFSDVWRPQIETVSSFMNRNGIFTPPLGHEISERRLVPAGTDIGAIPSVMAAGKAMLPYRVKEAEDLRMVIDYLEGKVTGNKAIERVNEEVRLRMRSGFIRESNLPCDWEEGLRVFRLENARTTRATLRSTPILRLRKESKTTIASFYLATST